MPFLDLEPGKETKEEVTSTPTKPTPTNKPGFFQEGGAGEAALRSFATNATLGLAPRAAAGWQSMLGGLSPEEEYQYNLAAEKRLKQNHPTASLAGAAAGSLAPALVTGGGSIPAQMGKQALLSAAETGITSDKSDAELLKEMGTGAGISAAITGAIPLAGKVIKGGYDLIKGTPDKEKLAEAAIKFSRSPIPPVENQSAPRAGKNAWSELNTGPEISQEAKDMLTRQGVKNNTLSDDTIKEIIHQHNKGVSLTQRVKDAALPTATGAVTGGVGAGYLTDWDPEKMFYGAATGAASGAAAGARGALSGQNVKLRQPFVDLGGPSTPLSNAVQLGTETVKNMGIQAATRDIKDTTGTSHTNFGKLSDYLNAAYGSSNPEVSALAQQAQAVIDENDPDKKRKLAMELSNTETGRAVMNKESPIR